MAIGRGSMTKEMFGNRQPKAKATANSPKKMAMGGMAGMAGASDLSGRDRGQAISAMARPPMPSPVTTRPVGPSPMVRPMRKGGSVRGCGCAKRGKSGAKVY